MLIGNRYRRVSGRHRNKEDRCPATLKTRWLPTPFLTRQIIHCHCNCCIHSYIASSYCLAFFQRYGVKGQVGVVEACTVLNKPTLGPSSWRTANQVASSSPILARRPFTQGRIRSSGNPRPLCRPSRCPLPSSKTSQGNQ